MNTIRQVLAIDVILNGAELLEAWITKLPARFAKVSSEAMIAAGALMAVGVAVNFLQKGIEQNIQSDQMMRSLEGLVESSEIAYKQMQLINQITSKGIFKRDDVFESVKALDLANMSLSKYIGLAESLGARTGKMKEAAQFLVWFKGAPENTMNWALFAQLKNIGITPQMLKPYGVSTNTQSIMQRTRVEQALMGIAGDNTSLLSRMLAYEAQINRMNFAWLRFQETTAKPLLPLLTGVLTVFNAIGSVIGYINNVSQGWVGLFAVGGVLLVGLAYAVAALKMFMATQLTITALAWLQSIAQGLTLKSILGAIPALITWVINTTQIAFNAAIAAAAVGNYVPLIAMGLGLAGIGIGAAKAYEENAARGRAGIDSPKADRRPVRHDEIENVWNAWQGRAWSG